MTTDTDIRHYTTSDTHYVNSEVSIGRISILILCKSRLLIMFNKEQNLCIIVSN
jgi:hypothetical protein